MLNKTNCTISIILAIFAILTFFNFKPERHSLEYVLSDPVPHRYSNIGDIYCQELTVTNTGHESIRGINISINLKNVSVADKMLGFSEDNLTVFPIEDRFEATYSELKIGHSFRISFLTPANLSDNLLVSYSNGRAKMKSLLLDKIGQYFFPTLFVIMIISVIMLEFFDKHFNDQFWKKLVQGYSLEETLNCHAPLFIKKESFFSYREQGIRYYWKLKDNDYLKTWSEIEAIKFLNSARPKYMSETEWNLCKECAVDHLQKVIEEVCLSKLYQLIILPLPQYCPKDIWEEKIITPCINIYMGKLVLKPNWDFLCTKTIEEVKKVYQKISTDMNYFAIKNIEDFIIRYITDFLFNTSNIKEQDAAIESVDFLKEEVINELKRRQKCINKK